MPIYFKGVVSAANFCTSLRRVELVLVAMKLEGEEGETNKQRWRKVEGSGEEGGGAREQHQEQAGGGSG